MNHAYWAKSTDFNNPAPLYIYITSSFYWIRIYRVCKEQSRQIFLTFLEQF